MHAVTPDSDLCTPRSASLQGFSASGFHRIAYTEWGDPGNPHVIVCAHGLTRNGRDFDWLARHLARDARVVCPDIVGRGDSDWLADPAQYGYPQYLADMTALIARVTTSQVNTPAHTAASARVDWVGTSMGGLIGMMLAAAPRTPIRRLVMNDIGPVLAREGLTRIATYAGSDPRFDSVEAFAAWLGELFRPWGAFTAALTDVQLQHLVRYSMRTFDDADGRTTFGLRYDPAIADGFRGKVFERDIELWPIWDTVEIPVLILRGAESEILRSDTARMMCERRPTPGASTALLEFTGIGHAPALADADQIAAVAAFLLED
ncbi:MAG: alpha/beta hydrolase [Proteobacteria bacterium]|nr:alpha/beta hydrolase [Burkholderiales bacterium]